MAKKKETGKWIEGTVTQTVVFSKVVRTRVEEDATSDQIREALQKKADESPIEAHGGWSLDDSRIKIESDDLEDELEDDDLFDDDDEFEEDEDEDEDHFLDDDD